MGEKLFQFKLKLLKKHAERCKQKKELMDAYAEYLPEKKVRKVSNVMLFTIVLAVVVYVIASFWLQYTTGYSIDSTITAAWFSFWGAEIVALAAIKTSKLKHKKDENEE